MEPFSHCATTQERVVGPTLTQKSDVILPITAITPKLSALVSGPPIQKVSPVQKDAMTVDGIPSTQSRMFPNSISSHLLLPMGSIHSRRLNGNELDDDRQSVSSMPTHREVTAGDHLSVYSGSDLLKYSELESRMLVQADVNKELKRLLVASIGSDLQHRLNQIAQERAVISHDLDASLQQLTENEEEMDRLSIECDIWRSKFLASRLMIDELAAWKAVVSQQLRESQRALQQLLQEHLEMKSVLVQCSSAVYVFHMLKCCPGCLGEEMSKMSSHQGRTILGVSETISSRVKMLREQAGLEESARNSVKGRGASSGEMLALQVYNIHTHNI